MRTYDGLDPDEYRAELIAMGASEKDVDAAVADLVERQSGGQR